MDGWFLEIARWLGVHIQSKREWMRDISCDQLGIDAFHKQHQL